MDDVRLDGSIVAFLSVNSGGRGLCEATRRIRIAFGSMYSEEAMPARRVLCGDRNRRWDVSESSGLL